MIHMGNTKMTKYRTQEWYKTTAADSPKHHWNTNTLKCVLMWIIKKKHTQNKLSCSWLHSCKWQNFWLMKKWTCQLNAMAHDCWKLFLWSLPIASNEAMRTVTVKAILFLTSKLHMCLTGSILLQCCLSAGKQKLTVKLVWQSSMQVTKGTCAGTNSVYQALFPHPPQRTWGQG